MRIHLPWIACALLSCPSFAQTKAPSSLPRTDSSVVRIGIRDFKNVQGDKRLDTLAESLPHLLRAGLFFEKRFQVTMLGKASESSTGSASQGFSSANGGLDLVVD
jgi:hypothetical protein